MRRDLGCRMGNPEDRPPGPAKALCRVSEHGRLTQRERVAARRHAEHPPVLATELRRAVVADREASTGDVLWLGDEPRPSLMQSNLLLILDRRHRRHRTAVAVGKQRRPPARGPRPPPPP